jgi:hypothetical protein
MEREGPATASVKKSWEMAMLALLFSLGENRTPLATLKNHLYGNGIIVGIAVGKGVPFPRKFV